MQYNNKTQTRDERDIELLNLLVSWQGILCQQQRNRPDRYSIIWGADMPKSWK